MSSDSSNLISRDQKLTSEYHGRIYMLSLSEHMEA